MSASRTGSMPASQTMTRVTAALRPLLDAWQWLDGKRRQQFRARRMRLAETLSLGEKRSVSILEIDGSQYLIGTAANSVQLLTVLKESTPPKAEVTEQAKPFVDHRAASQRTFHPVLGPIAQGGLQ